MGGSQGRLFHCRNYYQHDRKNDHENLIITHETSSSLTAPAFSQGTVSGDRFRRPDALINMLYIFYNGWPCYPRNKNRIFSHF